jgi:4-amino-4-deoxy-L-arabinose transferase-like glycosyltransferase
MASDPRSASKKFSADAPQALSHHELERATVVLLFLACLAYLWLFRRFTSMEPDEGIVLQGATRILSGQIPYRDFFSFYTPGSFYLVAGLFRIFGNSFLVARSSLAVAGALCSVLTYVLCRRVCSRGVSAYAAILATATGAAFRFLVLHNCYSTLSAAAAVYAAIRLVETRNSRWAFATGTLAATTFLFEQSKGGGLALGLLLGFLLLRRLVFGRPRAIADLAAGFAWPFLLTFGYFAMQHAFSEMLRSWLWPLRHYTGANHVPYGWQNWSDNTRDIVFHSGPLALRVVKVIAVSPGFLVPVLPLLGIGVLTYWAFRLRKEPSNEPVRYYVVLGSAMAGLLLSVVMVRPDILHFMYLVPLWYVALAWILAAEARSSFLNRIRPALVAYVAFAFGMLGFAVLLATVGAHERIETRRGEVTAGAPDTVIPFLQSQYGAGDSLLVYPYLPLYNYLTATQSPSRYDFFQPGMNTPEQAREIIQSLESTHAKAVLLEPWFAEKFANSWPETPLPAIAKDPVTDYIVRNFRVCAMLNSPENWRFHYMVRKDVPCPKFN